MDVLNGSMIYLNQGNENNYITLNTIGTSSNKNGIGARVTIYTPTGNQIRDVRAGEGFRHMSTVNVHFGLGTETEVTKIEVCWPSGIVDEIENPEINTSLTIVEGENQVGVGELDSPAISMFPNPTEGILNFTTAVKKFNVKVYDVSGKLVVSETVSNNQLNVANLPSGCYAISFELGDEIVNRTFIRN